MGMQKANGQRALARHLPSTTAHLQFIVPFSGGGIQDSPLPLVVRAHEIVFPFHVLVETKATNFFYRSSGALEQEADRYATTTDTTATTDTTTTTTSTDTTTTATTTTTKNRTTANTTTAKAINRTATKTITSNDCNSAIHVHLS